MNYFLKKHKAVAIVLLVAFMMTMVMPAFAATAETGSCFLTVTKTFEGITVDEIPADFAISVAGQEYSLEAATPSEDGLTYTWEISGLPAGTCSVAEVNADVEGYNLEGNIAQSVTLVEPEVAVVEKITTNSIDIYDASSAMIVVKVGNATPVWTLNMLNDAQEAAMRVALAKAMDELDKGSDNMNGYSRAFTFVSGTRDDSTGITFDAEAKELKFDGENKSSQVVLAQYSFNEQKVAITNTYSKVTVSGQKNWVDDNDAMGIRPSEITVNLLEDGEVIDSAVVSEATDWAYSFEDLAANKVDENGRLVDCVYTVAEATVPVGYMSIVEGTNITNLLLSDGNFTVAKVVDGTTDESMFDFALRVKLATASAITVTMNETATEYDVDSEEYLADEEYYQIPFVLEKDGSVAVKLEATSGSAIWYQIVELASGADSTTISVNGDSIDAMEWTALDASATDLAYLFTNIYVPEKEEPKEEDPEETVTPGDGDTTPGGDGDNTPTGGFESYEPPVTTTIPDTTTPQAQPPVVQAPVEEITEAPVPQAEAPVIEVPGEEVIEEQPVPQAALPADVAKTGDSSNAFAFAMVLLAAGAGLVVTRRKFN